MAGAARARAARPAGQRRADRRATRCSRQFPGAAADAAQPVGHSPADRQPRRRPSRVRRRPGRGAGRRQPADRARLRPAAGQRGSSTCARARAASRWRSPPPRPAATILATDTNRARLSKLRRARRGPGRRSKPGCSIPPHELEQLADWRGTADVVLVDAPCSGSGTWRRNPEGALAADARAARPAGRAAAAAARHRPPSWSGPAARWSMRSARCCTAKARARSTTFLGAPFILECAGHNLAMSGVRDGTGRLLTPGHDGTDGFFVARLGQAMLGRPCEGWRE